MGSQFELRLQRIGLLDRPLAKLGTARRAALIAEAYGGKLLGSLGRLVTLPLRILPFARKRRLTDTYLDDPAIRALPPATTRETLADEA